MADRIVNASDTFETFRTTFNSTAADVGDIASITNANGVIEPITNVNDKNIVQNMRP